MTGEGATSVSSPFLDALRAPGGRLTVELRPPRADLDGAETMDVWIDTYQAVRRLTSAGRFVFLTDDATGTREEENLAHLGANLSDRADPDRVVPFLTCKHPLDYCLLYAQRAWAQGVRALTVLGGDREVGPPRCVAHAYMLREEIRRRVPGLALGGWANPHRDAGEQAGYLASERSTQDFWLTQVVSHHDAGRVESLVREVEARGVETPGVFGVFYYRSARAGTLERLGRYFPVPADALTREFEAGASPQEVCARSIRALRDAGARHLYLSNLPVRRAARTLEEIVARV